MTTNINNLRRRADHAGMVLNIKGDVAKARSVWVARMQAYRGAALTAGLQDPAPCLPPLNRYRIEHKVCPQSRQVVACVQYHATATAARRMVSIRNHYPAATLVAVIPLANDTAMASR